MARLSGVRGKKSRKKIFKTPNELLQAAQELNLGQDDFDLVDSETAKSVIPKIFANFTTTENLNVAWIWEYLNRRGTGLQTGYALEIIQPLFKPEDQVWLLTEDHAGEKEKGNFWLFKGKYGAVIETLLNHWGLEYYIFDLHLNWMIFENHHECLRAIGEPAETLLKARLAELDLPD